MTRERLHWLAGTITLGLFLLSGAYMRYLRMPPVAQLDDVTRAVYRSRHLFILFIAVVNLAVAGVPNLKRMRIPVAAILLLTPILFAIAFMLEPAHGIHAAVWSTSALYLLFGSAVVLVIAGRPRTKRF